MHRNGIGWYAETKKYFKYVIIWFPDNKQKDLNNEIKLFLMGNY